MCVTAQKVANPSMGCSMIFEGLPNTPSPRRPLMVNSGADIIVVVVRTSSRGTFARFPHRHIRVIMPAVADDWCWGAESQREAIAGDGRCSMQGAAEY